MLEDQCSGELFHYSKSINEEHLKSLKRKSICKMIMIIINAVGLMANIIVLLDHKNNYYYTMASSFSIGFFVANILWTADLLFKALYEIKINV